MEPTFFEIPIYRLPRDKYIIEAEKTIESKINSIYRGEKKGEHFENFKKLIVSQSYYPWNYNEIVGFLNLYIFGSQFRIDCWFVSNKRINKGIRKKKFINFRKKYEAHIDKTKSSIEIFEWILEQLEILQKEKFFKNRHFDLHAFKVVGRFIDWKTLCVQLNSWTNQEFKNRYFEDKL